MKVCLFILVSVMCVQPENILAARDKSRSCKPGRNCKIRLNSRLRFLRDLSRSVHKDRDVIDRALKSLNDVSIDRQFGTFDQVASADYDIPKYVCPQGDGGAEMLPCPSKDMLGRIHCINYYSLCDNKINCPRGEDEDPTSCLFHQASRNYMDKMVQTIYKLKQRVRN